MRSIDSVESSCRSWCVPRLPIRLSTYLLLVLLLALGTVAAATDTALAREPLYIEAGRSRCLRLKRQVERYDVSVTEPSIASGRLDQDKNRFCITGLQRGRADMTFAGEYRRILVGGSLREAPVPFQERLDVVVQPPRPDVRTVSSNYVVSRGGRRTTPLRVFFGDAFANRSSRGETWQNGHVRLLGAQDIVAVRVFANQRDRMMVEITGLKAGQAKIEISGERRVSNDWQKVLRVLEVRVS